MPPPNFNANVPTNVQIQPMYMPPNPVQNFSTVYPGVLPLQQAQ
ncbi:unnamed protein product, partial [Rotaria socialis]